MTSSYIADRRANSSFTTLQIGMTASTLARGGLDRYFFSLNRALPQQGVNVRGLVVGEPGDLDATEAARCFAPENVNLIARWRALRREFPRTLANSELIVSHFAPYAFPILDHIRKRSFVVHFHGPWASEGAQESGKGATFIAKRLLERVVYKHARRIVVLSRAFGSIVEREYGVKSDLIRVVPGGVDLERFMSSITRSQAKAALGWPTDRPIVFSVRRLVRAKGLENLIEAVSLIKRSVPDVLVVIGGTGPLEAELKRRVADANLQNWVRFVGYIAEDQLPTMYRAADLFVVPTIALEGFGLVVVEALACGTPVLVTPIAGLPEVIADLDPALTLSGSEAKDLAEGIEAALQGRLRLPTDDQCIAYAQRFSWSSVAARVAAVYRETL